jgi:two-component system, chemotaxis family, protein-glutamate methylesterase/glutaminase
MEEGKIGRPAKVVLIGGSAGSLEVLLRILALLTPPVPFAIVVVLHRKETEDALLEELVGLKTQIPVHEVEDKTAMETGSIYIAPSGYHLLFEDDGTLSLDASEKVNYSRPSIDVTFISAADVYGCAVSAILLSGANADGTDGLVALDEAGARIIVQDPATASMPFMPQNAIDTVTPDLVAGINGIVEFLYSL